MSVLIWIQTMSHSYSVNERIFFDEYYFKEEKNVDDNQSMKNYLYSTQVLKIS